MIEKNGGLVIDINRGNGWIKYPKYLEKGMVFSRLTVIVVDKSSKGAKPSLWKYRCVCICGTEVLVTKGCLCYGVTKSCGCIDAENLLRLNRSKRKVNRIEIDGDITKIFFFNTNNYTIIDSEDYERVKQHCWYEREGYVKARCRDISSKRVSLHRLILNPSGNKEVDHVDGDKLNNKKGNLRECTRAENTKNKGLAKNNKTGCSGVFFVKDDEKYKAYITVNKKRICLGTYINKQDAINSRHDAEIKYFGRFAPCVCRGDK